MSWAEKRISELGEIVTGKTPSTKVAEFFGGEYPFVTPSDIEYGHYYARNTETTVTELAKSKHRNQFVPKESVLFTCIGNTMGKCAIAAQECMTNQQINAVVANGDNDPKFLYYLLHHSRNIVRGIGMGGGAATPIINKTTFGNVKLRLPTDKLTQQTISSVLSAYDDLIENNRRRIELLEESARQLYKEWFVRFRFPGHEHVKIIDGVPEGWEKTVLGAVSITNALSHKAKELPEEVNYIDISAVSTGKIGTKNKMSAEDAPGRARRIAKHGDVIWSNVRPNLKAYALVLHPDENDVFSTGFTTISGTGIPYSFLYNFTTTDNFVKHLVNHTTGSSYPAVRPPDFERAELLLPPQTLLEQFHAICEPSYELAFILGEQTKQLAEARDLLLPKVMSGEIAV